MEIAVNLIRIRSWEVLYPGTGTECVGMHVSCDSFV